MNSGFNKRVYKSLVSNSLEDLEEFGFGDLTVVVLVNGIDQGVDFFVAGLSAGSHLIQSGVDQIDDFVSVKCHTVISVELIEDGIDCGSEFLI